MWSATRRIGRFSKGSVTFSSLFIGMWSATSSQPEAALSTPLVLSVPSSLGCGLQRDTHGQSNADDHLSVPSSLGCGLQLVALSVSPERPQLSVPSSLGCGLQPVPTRRRGIPLAPFSSLFIGMWSATLSTRRLRYGIVRFQFPLHWDVVCNARAEAREQHDHAIFQFPLHWDVVCNRRLTP